MNYQQQYAKPAFAANGMRTGPQAQYAAPMAAFQPVNAMALGQGAQLARSIPAGATAIQEIATPNGEMARVTTYPSLAAGASSLVNCPAVSAPVTVYVPQQQIIQNRRTVTYVWYSTQQSTIPVATAPTLAVVDYAPQTVCQPQCAQPQAAPCQAPCPPINSVQRMGASLSQQNFSY